MYFLGSANRTRGHQEKRKVAFATQPSILFFSELTLILMGAWLQIIQTKGRRHTLERPGADKQKELLPRWLVTLQKMILFCDGQVFFIDMGLLMGAWWCNLEVRNLW